MEDTPGAEPAAPLNWPGAAMPALETLRNIFSLVRLRAFDVSTEGGRSKERLRRAALTALAAGLARAVSAATPLVTIKLSLAYLGKERYGLWMAVSSLVGMLGFADLGLGNGLVTFLCRARGRDDLRLARRAVSSTLVILLGVACAMVLCLALLWPFVPWARVVNAQTAQSSGDAQAAAAICLLTFIMSLPLGVVQRTQAGFQEEYHGQLWQAVASILGMLLIVLLVRSSASFPVFLLVVGLAGPMVMALNGLVYFGWQRAELRPGLREWDKETARLMLKQGVWFFVLGVMTLLATQADNLVVAQAQGLASVPSYSIPSRMFGILGSVGMMIYQPMWAANGEAMARGELGWVRRNTWRVSMLGTGLVLVIGIAFILLARPVFRLWLGPGFEPSYALTAGLAGWTALISFVGPYFMVLNGANVVRPQVYALAAFTVVSLALKCLFAKYVGTWTVPWAAVVPYAIIVVPFVLYQSKRVLSQGKRP